MSSRISRVVFINRLINTISNVRVIFGQSTKSTSFFSYISDFRGIDIENQENISRRQQINFPDVVSYAQVFSTEKEAIKFEGDMRCYWQIYFEYEGRRYKIDKNNAMMNLESGLDNNSTLDIIVRKEGDKIRVNMIIDSGQAYFYFVLY